MVTRLREATLPRVALAADEDRTAGEAAAVASARGFPSERLGLEAAVDAPVGAIAFAPAAPPDLAAAARLAPLCQTAAERRRPIVLLAAFERVRGRAAEERAATLAYLRAHGALVAEDPDTWFETVALLAAFGAPPGPRVAVVAPPGGWLHLQATALALEGEARGGVRVPIAEGPAETPPVDIALVDGAVPGELPERVGRALVVPVVARAEALLAGGRPALVGLRAALHAAALAGAHAERLTGGLGPLVLGDRRPKTDRARADKAFAAADEDRLGDHETKLFLSAHGVPVTRQGVASTPSAATRIAKACGWPVEVKPWAPSATPERAGGPIATGVRNPPDVRRAFASVASDAGLTVGVPVIVRVTPPPGRDLAARIERLPEVGWTVLLEVPGAGRPLAAPAPLRRADAEELAAGIDAGRGGDPPPDRAALAELLTRASFAVLDREAEVEALELGRIVVGARGAGAVVVDGRTRLRHRSAAPARRGR